MLRRELPMAGLRSCTKPKAFLTGQNRAKSVAAWPHYLETRYWPSTLKRCIAFSDYCFKVVGYCSRTVQTIEPPVIQQP
jgi:hypothetical protein